MTQSWTVTFSTLPQNLEELKALPMADLKNAHETAALAICALAVYPNDPDTAIAMLDFLGGPRPLSTYDKQFLRERFRGKDYIVNSYFKGASVENGYTPSKPYTLFIEESAHSRDQEKEGYLLFYIKSAGADSPRQIKVRNQPSSGKWFLWEQMLLADIRIPKAMDPWA